MKNFKFGVVGVVVLTFWAVGPPVAPASRVVRTVALLVVFVGYVGHADTHSIAIIFVKRYFVVGTAFQGLIIKPSQVK